MSHRVAVATTLPPDGAAGGAERLAERLVRELRAAGWDAGLVAVDSDETRFFGIVRSYAGAFAARLSEYDAVVSLKAPAYAVPHPRHVVWLLHQQRASYELFDPARAGQLVARNRDFWPAVDRYVLDDRRVRARFALSGVVASRLRDYCGLDAAVLYPGPVREAVAGRDGGYLFTASRIVWHKGIGRILEAFRRTKTGGHLKIAGAGPDRAALEREHRGDPRIEWLGEVDDGSLARLYAGARAVVFTPRDEDFGYVALEALASGRPVITCADAGGPLEIVRDGIDGRVAAADAPSLASAMDELLSDASKAARMGRSGRARARAFRWDRVVARLEDAIGLPPPRTPLTAPAPGVVRVGSVLERATETRSRALDAFGARSRWTKEPEPSRAGAWRIAWTAARLVVRRSSLAVLDVVPYPYAGFVARLAGRVERAAWRSVAAVELPTAEEYALFRALTRRPPRPAPAPAPAAGLLPRRGAAALLVCGVAPEHLDTARTAMRLVRAAPAARWRIASFPRNFTAASLRSAFDLEARVASESRASFVPGAPTPDEFRREARESETVFFVDAGFARALAERFPGPRYVWVGAAWPFETELPGVVWLRSADLP